MEIRDIRIILVKRNDFWVSILESEGIPFKIIHSVMDIPPNTKNQIIITWFKASKLEKFTINALRNNGNVLLVKDSQLENFSSMNFKQVFFDYSKIDFGLLNDFNNDSKVSYKYINNGPSLLLGLYSKVENYWSNSQKSYKKICLDVKNQIYCTESLNRKVKYNIRLYIRDALIKCFAHFDLPLIYIWRFPEDKANVCNLRIDVDPDRNTAEDIAFERIVNTIEYAKENADKTTFFVNFYKRKNNLDFISLYKEYNFDIQNHNYFHCLYPTYSHNLKNFELGHNLLLRNSINSVGFSAPEYFWYNSTKRILEKYNYKYSHSFGLDYNNYPYRPIVGKQIAKYIEIPNDPLVFSKLISSYKNISPEEITKIYIQSLLDKINSYDIPCIKYEHPNVLGKFPIIMNQIYSLFNSFDDVVPITLTKWASWLEKRNEIINDISIGYIKNSYGDTLKIESSINGNILAKYGIALQYDSKEIHVKSFDNKTQQEFNLKNFKKFVVKENELLLNKVVFQNDEKKIGVFHSLKHLKKLISNYKLFYKYKKERFYLD